jgi:sec-independent protein translocase protein TatC
MSQPQDINSSAEMGLVDHLTELRDRVVKMAYIILFGFAVCWIFKEQMFNIVRSPIEPYLPTGGLVFTNPVDKFMAYVKLVFVAGLVLTAPLWLYQVWKFVAPGLLGTEKKYAVIFIFAGTVLFLTGVCFAYFLILPSAFKFLFEFGSKNETPMITIKEYFSFVTTMALVFGISFELPLVITLLGFMGIVDQKFLRTNRRYAVVALAVISAVATPPDAASMLMLLVPLCVLYEISILCVGMLRRTPRPAS